MLRKNSALACCVLAFAAASVGCLAPDDGNKPGDPELRPAWVLAIDAPAEIPGAADLVVTIDGIAGPDLCYRFERIDVSRESPRILLAGVARYHSLGACATAISDFQTQLTIPGPFASDIVLVGLRPDGTSVEVPVRVRP
jgi:hypothetical protein